MKLLDLLKNPGYLIKSLVRAVTLSSSAAPLSKDGELYIFKKIVQKPSQYTFAGYITIFALEFGYVFGVTYIAHQAIGNWVVTGTLLTQQILTGFVSLPFYTFAVLRSWAYLRNFYPNLIEVNKSGIGRLYVLNSGPTIFYHIFQIPYIAKKVDNRRLLIVEKLESEDTPKKIDEENWIHLSEVENTYLILSMTVKNKLQENFKMKVPIRQLLNQEPFDSQLFQSWREKIKQECVGRGFLGRIFLGQSESVNIEAQLFVSNDMIQNLGVFTNGPGALDMFRLKPAQRLFRYIRKNKITPSIKIGTYLPQNANQVESRSLSYPLRENKNKGY